MRANKTKRVIIFLVLAVVLLPVSTFIDSASPTIYDAGREYFLPYQAGDQRFVIQGYDGYFGHQGYELDFVMPVGTLILASRGGIVADVLDFKTDRCPISKDCLGNYIYIDHLDGTWAGYVHIKQGGACVEQGQRVERGDAIALSGNVGISLMPHLHFYVGQLNEPLVFADVDRRGTGIPVAGKVYNSSNELQYNFCEDANGLTPR